MLQRISRGFVLRKVQGRLDGFDQCGLAARTVTSTRPGRAGYTLLAILSVLALALAFIVVYFAHPEFHTMASAHATPFLGVLGAVATPPKTPANIRKMQADLKAIATELEQGQVEMAAGFITPERGEELNQKAHEMEQLQAHIDQYNSIAGLTGKAREVRDVILPNEREDVQRKRLYTTPGHLFVASQELAQYKQQGKQGWSAKVDIGKRFGKKVLLSGEEAAAYERKFDSNTLPILGTDAIIPYDRDPEIVRFADPEILTIRDVLNVVPTTSDAIRYVRLKAVTRAAKSQASRGDTKDYLKLEYEPKTSSVETIAVLSKVTEQDIDDAPRLVGFINGEMTLDVKVEEERQLTWGDGLNGNLLGLFAPANEVPEFDRAGADDTPIDTIRRMRTNLRKRRVTPNFVTIDPIDWEAIELAKGSTEYYIWGLVSDLRGPRIWSLRVIESDAMTNLETGERRILVGDGIRGATIYDRSAVQLAVGFVDDDFARNLRTLRAEERLALIVKRSFAFEYAVTANPSS